MAATTGLGEDINFLTAENHIFLNKLNYICKNYDTSFKDVSDHRSVPYRHILFG